MTKLRISIAAVVMAAALGSAGAHASLTSFQTFTGKGIGVSTDGWGSTSQVGVISASVPVGAVVKAAYLYTSTFFNSSLSDVGGSLAGLAVNYSTNLGTNSGLTAGRADVTSIIKPLIDGGIGGVYDFAITETTGSQDGEALVVVYEDTASTTDSTVGILDGFSLSTGDSTSINFASALDPTAPGFFAEMRLGIGYSYDGDSCTGSGQTSTVNVNGTFITNNAGCNDDSADAVGANGNLITVGSFDDAFSALLPATQNDHERYNLVPYITKGDTSISVTTRNASSDDNIFLAVFATTGKAGINAPPPATDTPEPATLGLLGAALVALGVQRNRKAKA